MEIQVGEYVRTKNGIIAKLEYINELSDYFFDRTMYRKYSDTIEFLQEYELEEYIKNHSFEPIDLVKKGDYVNNYRVVNIMEDMKTGTIHLEMTSDYTNPEIGDCTIYNEDIKSIVTKEMYESIKYEV